MSHILIIGAGQLGQALQSILAKKPENTISFWDVNPDLCTVESLESALEKAELLFCAIPASAVRTLATRLSSSIPNTLPIISLAKGLEPESGLSMEAVWQSILPEQPLMLLSGPMLAVELKEGKPGWATIATADQAAYQKLQELFAGTPLHLSYTDDLRGVALAGVLKNVYALSLGVASGLQLGQNSCGALAAAAIQELTSLGRQLGGREETFTSYAGVADFLATGFSKDSTNYNNGHNRALNLELGKTGEGLQSLAPLLKQLQEQPLPPILKALERLFIQQEDPRTVLEELLKSL